MRSVRLDETLEKRVRQAAEAEGASVSEFIRRAAAERADRLLAGGAAARRLADVIGAVHGRKSQARRSGSAFTDAVAAKHRSAR